jgi:enoyl-CoA hydratase/carnithine racemase
MQFQNDYLAAYRSLKLTRDAHGVLVVEFHSNGGPFTFTAQDHTEFVDAFYRIAQDRATFHDVPHFPGGMVPGDGISATWSYRAGAGRAEAFLLNAQPLTARTAHEWRVVSEVVPHGKALCRARELAQLYSKAPEVTRRNTRVHFMQPLKERLVREVGYGPSLERASAADLVKSMQGKSEPVARKGKSA